MKLKKLVALITAGALCLGMSMTAFAADDNKSPDKVPSANGWANGGDLGAINTATEKEVQEIADEAMNWLEKNKPNIADGTYSLIEGKLVYNAATGWAIEAEMDAFSPVTFFKVMSNGKIVEVDWKGDVVAPKTKTVARTTSPKTGE